jgi:type II secretory pathway component PulJ
MNPAEMVVAIVFLGVMGSILTSLIRAFSRNREQSADSVREADELRDQILTLEDRIRVLERIVTDSSSSSRENLRRQFRDLER